MHGPNSHLTNSLWKALQGDSSCVSTLQVANLSLILNLPAFWSFLTLSQQSSPVSIISLHSNFFIAVFTCITKDSDCIFDYGHFMGNYQKDCISWPHQCCAFDLLRHVSSHFSVSLIKPKSHPKWTNFRLTCVE